MKAVLSIRDLHVSVAGKPVVCGVNLEIHEYEVHALMGPNGSGKSSLVHALMGHPAYTVTSGAVLFLGKDLLVLEPSERARAGLFLAFQYPREIAGVTLRSFLRFAKNAVGDRHLSPLRFKNLLAKHMQSLKIDPSFADRFVNKGFSGGEKKKAEILQLAVLEPRLALLDETDSGLDVDALKIVAERMNSMRPGFAPSELRRGESCFTAVLVTHYARILHLITPDMVHVMVGGRIVESGAAELARRLESEGYGRYGAAKPSFKLTEKAYRTLQRGQN